jgi:hypothetical protein
LVQLAPAFEYAVGLARGEPDINKPAQYFVPRAHIFVAHAYAENLYELFRGIYWQFHNMRGPPLTREDARQFVARAFDAATAFELETRLRLNDD